MSNQLWWVVAEGCAAGLILLQLTYFSIIIALRYRKAGLHYSWRNAVADWAGGLLVAHLSLFIVNSEIHFTSGVESILLYAWPLWILLFVRMRPFALVTGRRDLLKTF